ncbi:MAG: hypothetical protein KAI82_13650 [Tritonibacter mobilis]|uniref:hypothetical protein n=1 Tax=Tritonibacter mobilis TaxID=379347 RepID=UPI0001B8A316|nr:hypothetical protein [Tritonibacter mobilis]EEW60993.1 conserved hypothetical protein [Ruegeria sp. TrichCH4B]MCK5502279.1 hypothetical protein [Tritonibacter mobilis]NHM20368.1 hypothetical protein [Tritonibacter mobilis]NHM24532.1 hypothetical protein [Tritonibacter mobilis]
MIEAIFGLAGVIVGSFLTIAKDSYTSWRRRKETGSFSAIRLICILNEYADHCIDVVQDDGTSHGMPAGRTESGEEHYVAQVRQPAPLEYPDDIAWSSLPESLMHQILGLPNKARTTNRYIDGQSEYAATPPDYSEFFDARQEGYAKLGHDALRLAEELAEKFRIAATHKAELDSDWDPKTFLADKIVSFEEQRAKQQKRFEQQGGGWPPIFGSNDDQ